MNLDKHWLEIFYRGWSEDALESRLNELIMISDKGSEKLQIQTELERREGKLA